MQRILFFAGQLPRSRPRDKFARRSRVRTLVGIKIAKTRLHSAARALAEGETFHEASRAYDVGAPVHKSQASALEKKKLYD